MYLIRKYSLSSPRNTSCFLGSPCMSELSLQLRVLTSCMRENIFKFKALNLLYVHKCP